MSLCSSTTGGDVHYVSSKPSSECLFLNVSERQHCKTLDEYAINYRDNSDSGGNSVTMMFLPGVHSLTGNFSIEGKLHVTLVGQSSQINQTHIHLNHCRVLTRIKLDKFMHTDSPLLLFTSQYFILIIRREKSNNIV